MSETPQVAHVVRALKVQARTRLVYTLLSAAILITFLVSGFNFARNQSLGGFDLVFLYTWPHELEFYPREAAPGFDSNTPIDYRAYLELPILDEFGDTSTFQETFGDKADYAERLRNLVADQTGLGGANLVLVRDWGSFANPLNYLRYVRNIGGQIFAFISRTLQSAAERPGRIFFFPPYSAGDANADATIFEGTAYQYCPWGESYAQSLIDLEARRTTTEAGTNLSQGATSSIFTSGSSALREARDAERAATAALPCAGVAQILRYTPRAAWVSYLWHAVQTLNYAFFATLLGATFGLGLALLASRNITRNRAINVGARRAMDIARAFPELIILFVLAIGFANGSLVPIIVAVAFHTTGALGKLFAEVIENADMKPLEGLAAAGGSYAQRVGFGLMPQVTPNLLSYTALRVEINVRASAILGYVGSTGFGQDLRLAADRANGIGVLFLLFLLVAMIILIDQISLRYRRRLIGAQMTRA